MPIGINLLICSKNFSSCGTVSHLGRIIVGKNRIEILSPGTVSAHSASYRPGSKSGEFEKNVIDKILANNIIETAQAEWTAPFMCVNKENKTLRFCVNYRKPNSITKRESYPVTRIHGCIDSIGEATVFFKLDANSRLWQIEIVVDEMKKRLLLRTTDYNDLLEYLLDFAMRLERFIPP